MEYEIEHNRLNSPKFPFSWLNGYKNMLTSIVKLFADMIH